MSVNDALTEAMREAGMTDKVLASMVGLKRQAVWSYRQGKTVPRVDVAIRIAKILGVDLYDLWEAVPEQPYIKQERVPKQYALYRGDEFVDVGTVQELAERHGVKPSTIRIMATPSHHKDATENKTVAYRLED